MNAGRFEHGRGRNVERAALGLKLSDQLLDEIGHDLRVCRINAASATAFMPLGAGLKKRQGGGGMDAASKIREWLKKGMAESGLSAAAWAKKAGIAASTIQRAVKDDYEFITSSRTLAKLADAIGIAPPEIEMLSSGQPTRLPATHLPIRYEVGAGVWRSVEDVQVPYGTAPVAEDAAFAGFEQWLERVVTDSMDQEYPIGTLLHVVDAIAIGYAPRSGDHVIVERTQSGGMHERTCKEVQVRPGAIELWPRSHNPRWQEPLTFSNGSGNDGLSHTQVAIVGLVLGSYRRRNSP